MYGHVSLRIRSYTLNVSGVLLKYFKKKLDHMLSCSCFASTLYIVRKLHFAIAFNWRQGFQLSEVFISLSWRRVLRGLARPRVSRCLNICMCRCYLSSDVESSNPITSYEFGLLVRLEVSLMDLNVSFKIISDKKMRRSIAGRDQKMPILSSCLTWR